MRFGGDMPKTAQPSVCVWAPPLDCHLPGPGPRSALITAYQGLAHSRCSSFCDSVRKECLTGCSEPDCSGRTATQMTRTQGGTAPRPEAGPAIVHPSVQHRAWHTVRGKHYGGVVGWPAPQGDTWGAASSPEYLQQGRLGGRGETPPHLPQGPFTPHSSLPGRSTSTHFTGGKTKALVRSAG